MSILCQSVKFNFLITGTSQRVTVGHRVTVSHRVTVGCSSINHSFDTDYRYTNKYNRQIKNDL